jgi:hypothetical protein
VVGLTELLLRPERFFRLMLRRQGPFIPFLLLWLVGMGAVCDNMEGRLVISEAFGRPLNPMLATWPRVWGMVIIGGLVGGAFAWLIRGWWFKIRLRFSGAPEDVSPHDARLVWLYASAVHAIPTALSLAIQTPFYPDFKALSDAGVGYFGLLGLLLWSVWVGYRGAVGCFPVRRGRAILWFLILPMGWFLMIAFGSILGAFLSGAVI